MRGAPDTFSVFSTPAVSTQASATKAAQASIRHICTSITALLNAAAAQTAITLNLRDGATGAGNILWSLSILVPAGQTFLLVLTDLAISGTVGNAMTLEFSGAPVATNTESVAMTGYDAS